MTASTLVRSVPALPAGHSGRSGHSGDDDLCELAFRSLCRSDQRRWGQVYVHGLLSLTGRRSLRRMAAAHGPDGTEQALQQFVNQSPWDWSAVRRALAGAVGEQLPVRAWVVQEVEFPKNGCHSAGVAMQWAPGARRALNCQLGLAVWAADTTGAVPLDWRLMLPRSWDDDPVLRAKAHLPDDERSRTFADHLLDALDEMVHGWGLAPRPVVVDRRHSRRLEPLLRGLEKRGLSYAVRIDPHHAARELPLRVEGHGTRPQAPVAASPARVGRTRRLVPLWSPHSPRHGYWLTNIPGAPVAGIAELVEAGVRAETDLRELREGTGLAHFEGRSFQGWHHHVTLASLAHAHRSIPLGCTVAA